MREEFSKYALLAILLVLTYLTFRVLQPFITYLFFSIIFVIIFKPVYEWLHKKTSMPRTSSAILVLGLILIIVIPSFFITSVIVREAPELYQTSLETLDFEQIDALAYRLTGQEISVQEELIQGVPKLREYLIDQAGSALTQIAMLLLGLFIMFFAMFYFFTQGDRMLIELKKSLPFSHENQHKLFKQVNEVIYATINGQIILGVLQGIVTALVLLLLGVPYAIIWGFVTAIASILPVVGSYVVWIPIAIWLYLMGSTTQAIILLVVGFVIIAQIDNFLRPYVISSRADIHPITVIVGVFGGIVAFGVAGFIIGPLVLALFITVMQFYSEELTPKA